METNNIKVKSKQIDGIPYKISEKGVSMTWLEEGSPLTVVPQATKLHKVEKRAITKDMLSKEQQWALNDAKGYLRNRMKTDLLYLLNQGLGWKDVDYRVENRECRIPYQCDLAKFYTQKSDRIWVLLPRWHFKTTFTQGIIVQLLLNDPNVTIMLRSNTWLNATRILNPIQKRIKSPEIQVLFGNLEGDKWSTDEMNISLRTEFTREPNVFATGVGTDVTGLHPIVGILDDLQSENNYNTAEGRRAVRDDYEYCLLVVRKIIGNATRWDDEDLSGYLIEKNKSYPYDHPQRYQILVKGVYNDNNEPIFPLTYGRGKKPVPMYDEEWIDNKRRELGAYKFSCQLLNNPIPKATQVFKEATPDNPREGLQILTREEIDKFLKRQVNIFITVDPAGSDEKYSDKWAIEVWAVDKDMNMACVDYVLKKMSQYEGVKMLWKKMKQWKPMKTGVEQGILERGMRKNLKDWMQAEGLHFTIKSLKYGEQPGAYGRSKTSRIMSFVPYVENGKVFIGKWMYDLIDSLLRWRPYKNSNDDGPDAMSYLLQIVITPQGIKPQKQEDYSYSAKFHRWREKKFAKKGDDFKVKFLSQEDL